MHRLGVTGPFALAGAFALVAMLAIGLPSRGRAQDPAVDADRAPIPVAIDTTAIAVADFFGFGAQWNPRFWADFNLRQGVGEKHWKRVQKRLRWMRLPFVRMMFQMRWCSPQGGGAFDWNTQDMQSLYRHLDVCQQLGITVVLIEWGVGSWAKVPGFAGNDDPRYAEAVGVVLQQLVRQRGYSCVRYLTLVNEPNVEDGQWERWARAVGNVAREITARDLPITLIGSGVSNDSAWHERTVRELAAPFGIWDIHLYPPPEEVAYAHLQRVIRSHWDYVRAHDAQGSRKPLLVGEAGVMGSGYSATQNPLHLTHEYGVQMADFAAQAVAAGSSAVSAWMLDDSSLEGSTWGMWGNKAASQHLKPWFYTWALLARTVPPGSTLYRLPAIDPRVRLLAARHGTGWTFGVVNSGSEDFTVRFTAPDGTSRDWKRYLYSREVHKADLEGFPSPLEEWRSDAGGGVALACPAGAMCLVTSLDVGP